MREKLIWPLFALAIVVSPLLAQVQTQVGNTQILPSLVVEQYLQVGNAQLSTTAGGNLAIQQPFGESILQLLGVGATAVNGLYIQNATTGNPAVIGAVGSDTNIGIQLIAKGSSGNLGFQIINAGGANVLVPMQAGGTNSGTGEVALSGNTSGEFSIVGTPTGGHAAFTSNTTPTLGACNGAGSASFGSDVVGAVTGQTSATTSCTITFATAFANPPFCLVIGENQAISTYSATASVLTVNFPSKSGQQFVYYCFGL